LVTCDLNDVLSEEDKNYGKLISVELMGGKDGCKGRLAWAATIF